MKLITRTTRLLIATAAVAVTALVAPLSAHAILAGAESNGELVNSNRTPALQALALEKMKAQGVKVVRGNFGWNEVAIGPTCATATLAELEDPAHACYSWFLLDSLVSQANARGIQVLMSFTRTPTWVSGSADPMYMGASATQFNRVMGYYVAFHKAAATRYKAGSPNGHIRFWTVHNEMNSNNYWKPVASPARYAQLYAATAKAIHAAYPGALVAPGPTNPNANNGIKPVRFIRGFQANIGKYLPGTQARTHINAWAHNPYPGTFTQPSIPQGASHPEAVGMATINRLFAVLDSHASTKGVKVWATEFGWETTGQLRIPQARQAQFIAEAFHWLHDKRRVTIGISYGLTDPVDPNDWQSGTFNTNGSKKQSFFMYQRMISVPQAGLSGRVRRGTNLRIWGRANVAPTSTMLAYRIIGRKCSARAVRVTDFCIVPRQAWAADRARVASMRLTRPGTYQFATYGGVGTAKVYGPKRTVVVR